MKKILVTTLFIFFASICFGQKHATTRLVDSLRFIKTDTLGCNADIYWRIVSQGQKAIPFLIDRLSDTTPTNIKHHCKKSNLNVGEVAYFALTEIASFPAFHVTGIQFDVIIVDEKTGQACWNFYDFLFVNSNKSRYQNNVRQWYANEQSKYKVNKVPKAKRTDCQRKYGIDKFYRWTD